MSLQIKVSGAWKHVRSAVNVSGQWREVPQIYTKVSGAWKPLYSFSWEVGAWGACSASCGGGTQTRTVKAKRNDGQYFSDDVGIVHAGAKPATSQTCNTQACVECRYYVATSEDDTTPQYFWLSWPTGSLGGYVCSTSGIIYNEPTCGGLCNEGSCVPGGMEIDGYEYFV